MRNPAAQLSHLVRYLPRINYVLGNDDAPVSALLHALREELALCLTPAERGDLMTREEEFTVETRFIR